MTPLVSIRLWRWPQFLAAVAVSLLWVGFLSDQSIFLPGADGPRYPRQFTIAWLPVLGSIMLIDPTPDLTPTLRRADRVYRWLRCLTLLGTLLPLILIWAKTPAVNDNLYDAFIAGLLLTGCMTAVTRWQVTGLLAATLASLFWLLAGDTLATTLGFADITGAESRPRLVHWALATVASAMAIVTAIRATRSGAASD